MDYSECLVCTGRVFYTLVGHANQWITFLFFKCHASGRAVRKNEPALNPRPAENRTRVEPCTPCTMYINVRINH